MAQETWIIRRLALFTGLIASLALLGAAAAPASKNADVVLNQTQASDATGDNGTGPDLSGVTVTTYADGTVSFVAQMSNRTFLQQGETLQIFVDLNADGHSDINLSIWWSHSPSYLSRASGSDWITVRQLPELAESSGAVTVRLGLSELQSASAVAVGSTLRVAVGSWTSDSTGTLATDASDWLPSPTTRVNHPINAPTTTAATTTTTAATKTPTAPTSSPTPKTTAKAVSPPVKIERLPSVTAKSGKDVTLHILLDSHAGPLRLFKVCTSLAADAGVRYPTQCRSTQSTGAHGAVPFTITYRINHAGTTHVKIDAKAGTAKATTTAVVHIS